MNGIRKRDLLSQIAFGEDSTRQFKADVKNAESLASEMAGFANTHGGMIFIGVADDGSGIKRALEKWPPIDFTDDHDGCLFTATIHRKPLEELELVGKGALKVQAMGRVAPITAPLSELQVQLLGFIRSNPAISYDELAEMTQKDRTTVMRNIGKLKDAGILRCVGSEKTGRWEAVE